MEKRSDFAKTAAIFALATLLASCETLIQTINDTLNSLNEAVFASSDIDGQQTVAEGPAASNPEIPSSQWDHSGDLPGGAWSADVVDTARGIDYLSERERMVILEINKARTNPQEYARLYLVPLRTRYQGRELSYPGEITILTNEGVRALEECISVLSSTKPLHPFSPAKGLSLAAKDHARDQARTGATGHSGSDGSDLTDRIARYGKWALSCGENIDYGSTSAQRIVISLLVDDGVPSRGHRANIFSRGFQFVGVSVGAHPVYGSMCVMDFAGDYE